MSIADKLQTIAENEQNVFDAGYDKGFSDRNVDFERLQKFISQFFAKTLTEITEENMLDFLTYGDGAIYISKYGAFNYLDVIRVTFPFNPNDKTNGNIRFGYGYTFQQCKKLETFEAKGSVEFNSQAFTDCTSLKSFKVHKILSFVGAGNQFLRCTALENFDVGERIAVAQGVPLYLKDSPLTRESILNIFDKLKELPEGETRTLQLGADNLAKVTDEEKAIATGKGYTLTQ